MAIVMKGLVYIFTDVNAIRKFLVGFLSILVHTKMYEKYFLVSNKKKDIVQCSIFIEFKI